jgi:hypothetical protein
MLGREFERTCTVFGSMVLKRCVANTRREEVLSISTSAMTPRDTVF